MSFPERNVDAGAWFVSYDDAELYLYTGRQGMRFLCVSSRLLYRSDGALWASEGSLLLDTARRIGARYWVRSDRDFADTPSPERFREKADELLTGTPVVFQSSLGRYRVHDISSLTGR